MSADVWFTLGICVGVLAVLVTFAVIDKVFDRKARRTR